VSSAPSTWKKRTSRIALGRLAIRVLVLLTARRIRQSFRAEHFWGLRLIAALELLRGSLAALASAPNVGQQRIKFRYGEPIRLERLPPLQDLRGDRIGDVAEFRVLLDERGHHWANGNGAFAIRAGRLECLAHQDVRQAASAEPFIDLGVVENPLVAPISDGSQPGGLAVDGNGVLPVLGADGGLGAGLIRGHLGFFLSGLSGGGAWPQPAGRQGRCRQPCERSPVAVHDAEPCVGLFPEPAVTGDFVVTAPDEVPPHH